MYTIGIDPGLHGSVAVLDTAGAVLALCDTPTVVIRVQRGTRSTFTTGYGMGIWVGILATLVLPYTTVRPQVWKRALRLSRDKEASRLREI